MMAYYFACCHADRVTAVGSVAGSMVLDQCHPSRPVSVIELHGTADPEVPYQGGPAADGGPTPFDYPSTPALAQRWANLDSCPTAASSNSTGPATTLSWTGCQDGTAVTMVSVAGAGHVWFAPGLGSADSAVDATTTIWEFFHILP